MTMNRRTALGCLAGVPLAGLVPAHADERDTTLIHINPQPRHELSPFLYMQFMEPLGVTDGSVEASWDHERDQWRPDLIEVTRDLAPGMMRWGGLLARYYRWKEGVGPRDLRVPYHNIVWGGVESSQVGTAEFVDFSRRVGAEPLMCVNFESDGFARFREFKGSTRTADAREAAEWVAYCNHSQHVDRSAHGSPDPLTIKYWQLGNETSYGRDGFDVETAGRKTIEFAEAMRQADPSIRIIGWGDSGWAGRMAEIAGEHLQYLAFHHMFDPDDRSSPVLAGDRFRSDPAATWDVLMNAWKLNDAKIRQTIEARGTHDIPLAMTECHFAIPGPNRNDVQRTWAAGVSYARILSNHQRHGDVLKIATAADFCGTRWTVNAVMLPVPGNTRAYLMPAARIMKLYRRHLGTHHVVTDHAPEGLDVVASRSGDKLFVNVINTRRDRAITTGLHIPGFTIQDAKVFEMRDDPTTEVSEFNSGDVMQIVERAVSDPGRIEFPAASVSVVELTLS